MTANNMSQLEKMLMSQMKKAMSVAAEKMKADVYEQTASFYTSGNPKVYIRTGALGDTPRITPITSSGKSISYEVYLDQSHSYTTGTWDMPTVMENAEVGGGGILGKPGFWQRSERNYQKTLDSVMRSFFR